MKAGNGDNLLWPLLNLFREKQNDAGLTKTSFIQTQFWWGIFCFCGIDNWQVLCWCQSQEPQSQRIFWRKNCSEVPNIWEERKKAKNVILQFFPFFPPPCYCHSQSFWPFFFLLGFCWLILLVGCLLYPEGNYWAFFSFKNEKKTLLWGKNHVSFQFQYMWKWWKCKSVSFSLPWLPWHPIHLRKWDPKVHFHQVELPPGLRRWIHLSNIKDYHGKIIHHFVPSWKSLPPKSLTFKACPWDLWISMVGLGVVVVGGGVVGGGLGLHWTPAASVLSQSWIPQPSNLKFNYTFTLFPIKNFGPKRSFCNSVIHVRSKGKMRGIIWLLC